MERLLRTSFETRKEKHNFWKAKTNQRRIQKDTRHQVQLNDTA